MDEIVPVLLAGGFGTRLWPLSRKSYPKQFSNIIGDKSIFQQTALRLTSSKEIKFKPHISVTNSDFRFFVAQQLLEVGVDPGPILIEPEMKNTAPAILAATLLALKSDINPLLLVAPTDHLISNKNQFLSALKKGLKGIEQGKIITFGVQPTHAETGYGYLELERKSFNKISNLVRFIEKPDKENALKMISKGNFLWNSGMFLF